MSKGKLVAVCAVWLLLAGCAALAYRLIILPGRAERAERERVRQIEKTSAPPRYRDRLSLALDSFSGYAILRSEAFERELAKKGFRLELVDDGADYAKRLEGLQRGRLPMAAFTIDALIKASARIGQLPAVIVAIIDETRGADAMVANKNRFPNLDAVNDPAVRFVLTPDSPSETLARVVMSHFQLNRLATDPFLPTRGPEQTFQMYRQAAAETPHVYVLWEPYVSRMRENPTMDVLIDSGKFRGFIVDCLVSSRDFLAKHPSAVQAVLECYFRAAYEHRQNMVTLVAQDAQRQNQPLTEQQAERLVQGIAWKNTVENFAHFGLAGDTSLAHVEDMVADITRVLLRTQAISADPADGHPNQLYYPRTLALLKDSNFHPGLAEETVDGQSFQLPTLTESEWQRLRTVGELNVPSLVFARGTADLTAASRAILDELVQTLDKWPHYYVLVRGNAALRGDPEQNKQLAYQRAQAAANYLVSQGVQANRVQAGAVDPSGESTVSFIVGEAPY